MRVTVQNKDACHGSPEGIPLVKTVTCINEVRSYNLYENPILNTSLN